MKRFTVIGCVALFLFMAAMAAAAVPLYAIFCQATGYGGTTRRVEQYSDRILGRTITVRFDANTAIGLPWKFQPALHEIKLKIGETIQIHYTAENLSSEPTSGWASFNVMPGAAGIYFNKVECFCFVDTTLQPGEKMDMPVLFYIDPAIIDSPELKDLHTIILSYTFFPAQGNQRTEEPEKRSGKHGKAKREG